MPPSENVSPSKNHAPKESNRTNTVGVHLWSRPFYFVFSFHSGMWGQNPYQKRFLCPLARMCPPKKTQQDQTVGVHLWSRHFCFVFSLHPGMWGQNPYQRRFLCFQSENRARKESNKTDATEMHLRWRRFFGLHPRIYFYAPPKFSMPPSSPANYSGAKSAPMNKSEIKLKIVFLEDHNITSISTVCLGLGEDLFLFCLKLPHFQSCLPNDKLLGGFSFLWSFFIIRIKILSKTSDFLLKANYRRFRQKHQT